MIFSVPRRNTFKVYLILIVILWNKKLYWIQKDMEKGNIVRGGDIWPIATCVLILTNHNAPKKCNVPSDFVNIFWLKAKNHKVVILGIWNLNWLYNLIHLSSRQDMYQRLSGIIFKLSCYAVIMISEEIWWILENFLHKIP